MDPNLAINLLLIGLARMGEFGAAIRLAREQNRNLTPEEIAAAGFSASDALSALDAKITAAGG